MEAQVGDADTSDIKHPALALPYDACYEGLSGFRR
jgi:hypothetical protein